MKRILIRLQLALFRRCYCASARSESALDDLDDLSGMTVAVPWKGWAQRRAKRLEARTGHPWRVVKWENR